MGEKLITYRHAAKTKGSCAAHPNSQAWGFKFQTRMKGRKQHSRYPECENRMTRSHRLRSP